MIVLSMMSDNTKTHTDIKPNGWQVRIFPRALQPYAILARLDRPIGWWLLLLPGWWSIMLASGGIQNFSAQTAITFALFYIGAIVMRAAGCTINDLWDRNLDKKVERTQNRPLASGAITTKQALMFLILLLLIGASILFSFNKTTILLGLLTLPLIGLYPFMKRITFWPQAFLGLTFNFGALMGWSAITGEITLAPILIYIGGIFWTLGYDTIYAHQDKNDDIMVGIKSTALKFGEHSKKWVFGFYLISITLITLGILLVSFDTVKICLLLLPLAHMAWQLQTWDMNDSNSSLKIFKSNRDFGLFVLICCAF